MKKILILFTILMSFNLSAQDKSYWMCFNFSVEKQSDAFSKCSRYVNECRRNVTTEIKFEQLINYVFWHKMLII